MTEGFGPERRAEAIARVRTLRFKSRAEKNETVLGRGEGGKKLRAKQVVWVPWATTRKARNNFSPFSTRLTRSGIGLRFFGF
jgi:hypothetical protein